jgi:putative ABC transport system permease protein
LGAVPRAVIRNVVGSGLRPIAAGLALGVCGALLAARLLRSELYGVAATDPGVLAATVITLLATALLACWIPAWRATRLDPLAALRSE